MTTQTTVDETQQDRPNILFILIDDMGWMDLSCQGSTFYETPNIDSIAKDGMRFTRAYASCPVCSPTRASIMTGKYPARVGITQWIGGQSRGKVIGAPYLHYLPLEERTIARVLKEMAGYKTYHVGKWHLGDEVYWPEKHGFDVNIGGCHMGSPWHGYFSPYHIPTLADGPDGEYLTDRLTTEAIKLLECNGDEPFFMYMSYYSVHRPVQAPDENIAKYREKKKRLGLDKVEEFEEGEKIFFLETSPPRRIPHRIVQSDPDYAGMVERLDQNIGKLLETIDRLGKRDNTIIIFFSDNGGLSDAERAPTSNLPLRNGKSYMYEGGIREPLLVRWPSTIPAGTTCDGQVTTPDFYPTLLDCCGLSRLPEQHVDGKSFSHLFGKPAGRHDRGPIFWHYPHYNGNGACPASCIIDGNWKLIEWLESGDLELYDLEQDIGERIDLASSHPDVRNRLLAQLKAWQGEVGAKIPEPNPNYPYFLAKTYFNISGTLHHFPGEGFGFRMQLTPDNPALYDITIAEILEPFMEQTIQVKIGDRIRTGRLHIDEDERTIFGDTVSEENILLDDLVKPYKDQEVCVTGWAGIPLEYLSPAERKYFERRTAHPQVEISLISQ